MNTKHLLLMAAALLPMTAFAQSETVADVEETVVFSEPHRVYCELLGTESGFFTNKVKISVDFGQKRSFFKIDNLVDQNGKSIVFNSMIDGMNYMGQFGWKFAQAYVITCGQTNVYHWLLYKDILSEDEILEGFMTTQRFKNKPGWVECTIQFMRKPKKSYEWSVAKEEKKYIPKEDLQKIIDDWKGQQSDSYDYDVKVSKEK